MAQKNISVKWCKKLIPLVRNHGKNPRIIKLKYQTDEKYLPEKPGIYIFAKQRCGASRKNYIIPLYIGCAQNVRKRVMGYFNLSKSDKGKASHKYKIMSEIGGRKDVSTAVLVVGRIEAPKITKKTSIIVEKILIRKVVEDLPKYELINTQHKYTPQHCVELQGNKVAGKLFGRKLFGNVK